MTDHLDLRLGQLLEARTAAIRQEETRRAILAAIASQPLEGRIGRGRGPRGLSAVGVGLVATLGLVLVIGLTIDSIRTPVLVETMPAPGQGPTGLGLPSNGLIAYDSHDGVMLADADGTPVMTLDLETAGERWSGHPSWSPDGSRLAYWIAGLTDDVPGRLHIVDAAGVEQLAVVVPGELAGSPIAWSPGGDLIVLTARPAAEAVMPSIHIVDLGAEPPQATLLEEHATDPVWSPVKDELLIRLLFPTGHEKALALTGLDGRESWLTERSAGGGYSWSPDGTRVVFGSGEEESGIPGTRRLRSFKVSDAYTGNLPYGSFDGGEGDNFAPAWSPDGGRIAYLRSLPDAATPVCQVVIASDVEVDIPEWKSHPVTVLPYDASCEDRPVWSPDGQWLAFATLDPDGIPAGTVLEPLDGSVEPIWLETYRPVSWQPVWP